MAKAEQIKEITAKLEQGVKDLFESDKYADYLRTMSRFHNYSSRNIQLIHQQLPTATVVCGFNAWKNNFNRHVKKGEHGIKIFAPIPFKETKDFEKLDPVNRQPILDENGQPIMETLERSGARFKVVTVFDVSSTDGEPLPELAQNMTGDVERYELFMDALRAVSPLPIVFEPLTDQDGYCRFGDKIGIREGMSEVQTVSAVVHEITHALLDDRAAIIESGEKAKSNRVSETIAESVAFVVNYRFGVDTGANSFGYVAEYAKTRELKELNNSLDTIRKTAASLIDSIDGKYRELAKERGIDLTAVPQRSAEVSTEQNYNMIDGIINNEPPKTESEPYIPGWEDIPLNDRDLVSNIQGYIQSVGKVMDISDYEIYQNVLKWREREQPTVWDTYRSIGDLMLNERILNELKTQHEQTAKTDDSSVREKLSALSNISDIDAKYELAVAILVGTLCANEQLLALANTGENWQHGAGRLAVYDGKYYETLIDTYRVELADLLDGNTYENKLRNVVKGEVYRRLDTIAYDRYILDEYADICKAGRLEVYLTPYPEESDNTGVMIHLTEQLPDGSKHDYGEIYGYDPGDTRDHAISNYLSLKSFNELRESIFGKPETTVTLDFKETSPVGSTVLRPLLYTEGQFNRENKRTRVDVLPPMGKYSVYEQHLSGDFNDNTLIHVATDSGYLLPLGVSKTRFDEQFIEAQIDRIFEKAHGQLEAQLANPETFARYEVAAITGRVAEVEAHNAPVRKLREEKDKVRRDEAAKAEKEEQRQKTEKYDARVDEIATAIGQGKTISVGYNQYEFGGKNPVLDLFKLYGIELPLRTQGWVNTGLAEITESGYRYYSSKHKGNSTTFSGYLSKLRDAIKDTPIEQKRARDLMPEVPDGKKEMKNTLENKLFEKFAELFPDLLEQKYSYMKLESPGYEPLSLEWIFGDRLSVMQTYVLNGDLMYDPMIEFEVNDKARTMNAVVYQDSGIGLYQYHDEDGIGRSVDGNGNEHTVNDLSGKLNAFSQQWFSNLEEQGHIPVRATIWNEGRIDDVDVSVTFDKDGKPVIEKPDDYGEPATEKNPPENHGEPSDDVSAYLPDKEYSLGYGFMGNGITVWNHAEEQNGDYVTVAHIETDRSVIFYDKDMPESVKSTIKRVAQTMDDPALKPLADKQVEETAAPLPDPTVTIAAMNAFGYTAAELLPLSQARAIELFENGNPVYLLYPDNTESMVLDADEIKTHDGLCGIEVNDWERIQTAEKPTVSESNRENVRESALLHSSEPMFGIYQVKDGDEYRDYRFLSSAELFQQGLSIDRNNYNLVYTAPLSESAELGGIFAKFNFNIPDDFTGHSLSMSDVIVFHRNNNVSSHYLDRGGYLELPSFTGDEHNDSGFSQVGKSTEVTENKADKRLIKNEPQKSANKGILAELDEAAKLVGSGGKQDNHKKTERGYE